MPRNSRLLARLLPAFLLGLLALTLALPMLCYPFGRDQGMFACGAEVLQRGGTLYRDYWDLKPPGIYYLYWMSFFAFGRSMFAPRIMDLLFTLATAGGLFLLGRRLFSVWAGVLAALFFLLRYSLGFGYWDTAQADGFASLPLTAAMLLALAAERRASWPQAFLSGLLLGVAIIIKFTLGLLLLLPLVLLLLPQPERGRPRLLRAVGYLLGAALVPGLTMLLLWQAGALQNMVEIMFGWNAAYAKIRASGLPVLVGQTWRFWFGQDAPVFAVMGLLALIGLVTFAKRREEGLLRWTPALWLALMLVQVHAQGKYFLYHWLPALPPFALLAGVGLAGIGLALRTHVKNTKVASALAAAGLAFLFVLGSIGYRSHFSKELALLAGQLPPAAYAENFTDRQDYSLPADQQVAAYLREHTLPEDAIFIWGFEPVIYFLADRPSASRFYSHQPLVTSWSPPEWRRELIEDLTRKRPSYLLVAHNDQMPWVTLRPYDSAEELALYPELQETLTRGYRLEARLEDFDLWRRADLAR
jgi:4-amino-4-deoxy-L-arabinose transferase-like glycosyltransferase